MHKYLFILQRYFSKKYFVGLFKIHKIINALYLLDNGYFNQVQSFLRKIESMHREDVSEMKLSVDKVFAVLSKDQELCNQAELLLENIFENLSNSYSTSDLKIRIDYLVKNFKLTESDICAVLSLIMLKQLDDFAIKELPSVRGHYIDRHRTGERLFTNKIVLSFMGEDPLMDYLSITSEDSLLLRSELIQDAYYDRFYVSNRLYNFIESNSYNEKLLHGLERIDGPVYDLESFNLDAKNVRLLTQLLKSNQTIKVLLTGKPGVGKTAFMRSVGAALGRQVLFVPPPKPNREGSLSERKQSLAVACITSDPATTIVAIDEADEVFSTGYDVLTAIKGGSGNKAFTNSLMDQSRATLFVAVNYSYGIDESTLRRFNLIFHFYDLTDKQRKNMINRTFEANHALGLLDDQMEQYLLKNDGISQGVIAQSLVGAINCSDNLEIQKQIFSDLIQMRLDLFEHQRMRKKIGLL